MATHALRNVAVLGATGSIGASALDVIARHPGRYRARVLAAGHNVDALVALCVAHRPDHAVIADEDVGLITPLMESLEYDLLPRHEAAPAFGVRLHSFEAAVERALREWERVEELTAR